MSVSTHYWAIPTESILYTYLQEDLALNAIMVALLPYSGDLYNFSAIDKEEREDIIDDIFVRYQSLLRENPQSKIDTFFAEMDRTRTAYPDIERRIAMIEKCDTDIERRLIAALSKEGPLVHQYENAPELVRKVMRGDGVLHPNLRQSGRVRESWEDILGLISVPVVKQGAAILSLLSPRLLFPANQGPDIWQRENYIRWRKAYIAAAKNEEAILVGLS